MLFNVESKQDIEGQRERRGYLHLGKEEKPPRKDSTWTLEKICRVPVSKKWNEILSYLRKQEKGYTWEKYSPVGNFEKPNAQSVFQTRIYKDGTRQQNSGKHCTGKTEILWRIRTFLIQAPLSATLLTHHCSHSLCSTQMGSLVQKEVSFPFLSSLHAVLPVPRRFFLSNTPPLANFTHVGGLKCESFWKHP